MFYRRSKRANILLGFALVAFGGIGLGLSSWLKHILHLPEGHMANAVDFVSGFALGIGISFVVVGFSRDMEASDFED